MLYDLLSDALVEKAFTHDALKEIRMLQFFSDIFWKIKTYFFKYDQVKPILKLFQGNAAYKSKVSYKESYK